MKDGQYYQISGWMGKHLELRGNDLICFAVIYGFSMDGESQFKGNLDYLTGCMFASRPTALLSLNHLLECNLILKQEEMINGRKHCYYATNVMYDEGKINVVDTSKEPLSMTSKEPLSVTSKEPLPKKYNNKEQYNKEEKELSNDNPKKVEESISFDDFYKLYPVKKSKEQARKSWNRLSAKDRKAAYDKLLEYIADCTRYRRSLKYPSTYLNQRTWEDDFTCNIHIRPYDHIEGEEPQKSRFKDWMRRDYPEIENTALPLVYEDYMELIKDNHIEAVTNALNTIHDEIYKYRKSDIAHVIKSMIYDEKED